MSHAKSMSRLWGACTPIGIFMLFYAAKGVQRGSEASESGRMAHGKKSKDE